MEKINNTTTFKEIIKLSNSISNIIWEYKKKKAFNLNVISAAARGKLIETGHSRILTSLLYEEYICASFLRTFLKTSISTTDLEKTLKSLNTECIKREKDNIDIQINIGDYYIIIENKINNASEQCGQIYRYIETAINKYEKKLENIYVLYLNPDSNEMPSNYSLSKDGKGYIFHEICDKNIKPLSYAKDILEWLESIKVKDIFKGKSNEYEEIVSSALIQYKDYLKVFFELKKDYIEMKENIKNEIIEILELKDLDYNKQNKKVTEALENAITLTKYLEEYKKKELRELIYNKYINDPEIKNIQFIDGKPFKDDKPILGFEFEYDKYKMTCALEFDSAGAYFYGIKINSIIEDFDKMKKTLRDFLQTTFVSPKESILLEGNQCIDFKRVKDKKWIVWKYLDENNPLDITNSLELMTILTKKILSFLKDK